jgi:hypothetical protein
MKEKFLLAVAITFSLNLFYPFGESTSTPAQNRDKQNNSVSVALLDNK